MSTTLTVANPNTIPSRYNRNWFRFFEMLPGICVWSSLLLPFILSVYAPFAVTVFVLVFDVYWLVITLNYSYLLIRGYRRLQHNLGVDWQARLQSIAALTSQERLERNILDWRTIQHAVILTTYKEEQSILEYSIESILAAHYPKEQLIFVLATEERDKEHARAIAVSLRKKYALHFSRFLITEHPDNITGEVKAKGANASWAARQLVKELEADGVPLETVIVSTADADSRFDVRFFQCLTYAYCVLPDRIQCSFQPISTYFNNIWDAPAMSRVLAFGTTFWQLIESVREYRLISFATHATSLRTLVEIDYWDTTIVNEDSRQFFRSFFHFGGKFRVVPLYIPIYMDAVHTGNFWPTMRNLYYQQQRWAYGVEHFPYIVLESIRRRNIPLLDRLSLVWRAFQGAFSSATSSFFISVVGWIPILLNKGFRDDVVVSNFFMVTREILSLTWVGLIISGILTLKVLSVVPYRKSVKNIFSMSAQYILTPFFGAFFGVLPGIDAVTRLMLGKYLGFRVTEKSGQK